MDLSGGNFGGLPLEGDDGPDHGLGEVAVSTAGLPLLGGQEHAEVDVDRLLSVFQVIGQLVSVDGVKDAVDNGGHGLQALGPGDCSTEGVGVGECLVHCLALDLVEGTTGVLAGGGRSGADELIIRII